MSGMNSTVLRFVKKAKKAGKQVKLSDDVSKVCDPPVEDFKR